MATDIGEQIQERLSGAEAKTLLMVAVGGLGLIIFGILITSGQIGELLPATPEAGVETISWGIFGLIIFAVIVTVAAPGGRATKGMAYMVGALFLGLLMINPMWLISPLLTPIFGEGWENTEADEGVDTQAIVGWSAGGCVAGAMTALAIGTVPPLTFLPDELIGMPAGCILGAVGAGGGAFALG